MPAPRAAIVTGVAMGIGGIGRAIAERLADDGMAVLMADLDPKVAEVAAVMAERHGDAARFRAFAGDLSVEGNVQAMVGQAMQAFGRIDVLVNNAGSGVIRPFLEHDAESFDATLKRNLWTTIWCCHKVLPHMVASNHGRIVNIGADSLRTGIPQHAGYNAAKGGVVGMMVGLAKEFAAYDITVNTVSPCVVNTERHRARLKDDPALANAFVQVVPKGRGVEMREICDMVSFLARAESAFMTGQDISLNGGSAMP
ncbi:MAG TPA: SDR family oxidoreductase [Caldimonas sp.]|nr:SDR family oxidoreductase [Caldimonas sp.]HEX2540359.1 SDR family oxidoreductase [Caldimonas sp.]